MKYSLRKFISSALTISTALSLTGIGLVSTAYASQLSNVSVTLTDPTPGASTTHTIAFKIKTAGNLGKVVFSYRTTASSGSTVPTNLTLTAASLGANAVTKGGTDETANWTFTKDNVAGTLTFTQSTAPEAVNTNDSFVFTIGGIANNDFSGATCNPVLQTVNGVPNTVTSDSCWLRINTYTDLAGTAPLDSSTSTYTVLNSVTVSATVDPTLSFTVAGVASGATNDSVTTSAASTPVTLPFGNLTIGTAKSLQQALTVLTNANNGYSVYQKFTTSGNTQLLIGTFAGNLISPFAPGTANFGWPEDTKNPATWDGTVHPTGTVKNVNSGWIGMRTSNTGPQGSFPSGTYAAPAYNLPNAVGKTVMKSVNPDNGLTPTYVTYRIEANAYQPSDTYTGTMVYNVVGSY